ncbi:MAG: class E sortase [Nitriliruptorales bacterium]|nr:class E sortase [Nitriliruptorales bacterium]
MSHTLELPVMQPRRSQIHGRGRRRRRRGGTGTNLLRWVGWAFMFAGAVVLLYLVYSLLFTNLQTEAAQAELGEQWQQQLDQVDPAPAPAPDTPPAPPPAPGDAVAMLEFARPGSAEPLVSADPLFVVQGVAVEDLKRGPGSYPDTAAPGAPGNFAVAGHRTTYGAPFFHLDQLAPGDEIFVTDRTGVRYTYRVAQQRVVSPFEVSVLQPDPLGTGRPTLTLTTCHPRFSAAQRLIVFAELV